ncbi:MAG: hypothetical protein ACXADW_10555 [Candidatus Hodarchaeales archaeon]|jgi:hypothetical protein
MQKGWEVELSNSAIIREGELDWNRVPKRQIVRLTLFYNGRRWDLTNKEAYFVKYRASMVPGIKDSLRIERRTIGFYEGASKVCYHVEEATGKFSMEVIDNSGH